MKTIQGDLLALADEGAFDVIAHGCNCFCNMGAGIALQIKRRYPVAFEADLATPKGAREKLGTANIGSFTVVNAYTQFHWSEGQHPLADYDAIRRCMQWIRGTYRGRSIGLPRIVAGLAGGDWQTTEAIIEAELGAEDVTLVEFTP